MDSNFYIRDDLTIYLTSKADKDQSNAPWMEKRLQSPSMFPQQRQPFESLRKGYHLKGKK